MINRSKLTAFRPAGLFLVIAATVATATALYVRRAGTLPPEPPDTAAHAEVALPPDEAFDPPAIPQPTFPELTVNLRDFGATGDGRTNDSRALAAAIDAAHARGGGTVRVPAGTYRVASVELKSNVRLLLEAEATITGAKLGYDAPEPNPHDKYQDFGHSHFRNAVLWGENIENFAIVGGNVDGGYTAFSSKRPGEGDKVVAIRGGRNIRFENVATPRGAHFVYLLNDCENVTMDGLSVRKTRDAINLVNCHNVAITRSSFVGCSDDAIAIKSDYALGRMLAVENVWVRDVDIHSNANALQFGSESIGDFRNCYFKDVRITKAGRAGIGITTNDGGTVDGVHYKDVSMRNVANPVFLLTTRRLRTPTPDPRPGRIRNITIENVIATDVVPGDGDTPAFPATLSGLPESLITGVTLDDVTITYKGNDHPRHASTEPAYTDRYYPRSMGPRPASGLYARHVRGLTLRNVTVDFESPTPNPPLVFRYVRGLSLHGTHVTRHAPTAEPIRLTDVSFLNVRECPTLPVSGTIVDADTRR